MGAMRMYTTINVHVVLTSCEGEHLNMYAFFTVYLLASAPCPEIADLFKGIIKNALVFPQ